MSKNMIIMNKADKEKVEQLIEEDLVTYCDNVINMVDSPDNYEMIINMSKLIITLISSMLFICPSVGKCSLRSRKPCNRNPIRTA